MELGTQQQQSEAVKAASATTLATDPSNQTNNATPQGTNDDKPDEASANNKSNAADQPNAGDDNKAAVNGASSTQDTPAAPPKRLIASNVPGIVKWFNVKNGYGFISRMDKENEDVFVHQSAIVKNNPSKSVRSVGDGETVQFDIVEGEKGNEAANVTGPSGNPVKGSQYAAERPFRNRRSYPGGNRKRRFRNSRNRSHDGQSGGDQQNDQSNDANGNAESGTATNGDDSAPAPDGRPSDFNDDENKQRYTRNTRSRRGPGQPYRRPYRGDRRGGPNELNQEGGDANEVTDAQPSEGSPRRNNRNRRYTNRTNRRNRTGGKTSTGQSGGESGGGATEEHAVDEN